MSFIYSDEIYIYGDNTRILKTYKKIKFPMIKNMNVYLILTMFATFKLQKTELT